MQRRMFLGKIHRARVTEANLAYDGSVSVDGALLDAAGILEHQEVHIWNVTQGTRLATYAIRAPEDSGVVCINGAAAHLNRVGDIIILAAFGSLDESECLTHRPRVVLVDEANRMAKA